MRVVLDANNLISYLLTVECLSTISEIVRAALEGRYQLLLPPGLLDEVAEVAKGGAYLSRRINPTRLSTLAAELTQVAIIVPRIGEQIPPVVRDRKDDYLLAYAVVGEADYLVTGDKDLLTIGQVGNLRIVNAHEFCAILRRGAEGLH